MIGSWAFVAFGGAAGALARHGYGVLAIRLFGSGLPIATFGVNVVGSLLMGVLIEWLARHGSWPQELRLALATGFLGSFTTFSTFSLDTVALWERGDPALAVAYVALSVIGGIVAVLLGLAIGRAIF